MLLRVSLIFEETSINLISGFTLVLVCLVTFLVMFLPRPRQLTALGKEGMYVEDQQAVESPSPYLGGKRRRGNKDDIEEDENGRGQRGAKGAKEEKARLTKKMRPGDGNILRSHVKVDFVERNLSYLSVDEKVSEKEGGGRVFTIDPPWTKNPPNIAQDLDQDKDMGEFESYRS